MDSCVNCLVAEAESNRVIYRAPVILLWDRVGQRRVKQDIHAHVVSSPEHGLDMR